MGLSERWNPRDNENYKTNTKLLKKFKPSLIQRLLTPLLSNPKSKLESELQYAFESAMTKPEPVKDDFIKAYYANRELERRARKQKEFIEKLEKK